MEYAKAFQKGQSFTTISLLASFPGCTGQPLAPCGLHVVCPLQLHVPQAGSPVSWLWEVVELLRNLVKGTAQARDPFSSCGNEFSDLQDCIGYHDSRLFVSPASSSWFHVFLLAHIPTL